MSGARIVDIGSGRRLEMVEGGDPGGFPVIVHNGTPMVAGILPASDRDAKEKGLRLISYGRPGYGGSTRKKGRSVADAAADVARLADALGLQRFATWGGSGGGPHALATAALLPGRVVAAASLAGVGPYGVERLDFTAGMGEDNVVEFDAALSGEEALEALLGKVCAVLAKASPEEMADEMASLLPQVDRAALHRDEEFGAAFAGLMTAAAERGIEGWIDDDLAFTRPRGFELGDIRVPVLLWQGDQDRMVPAGHGAWLAAHIPGVEARLTPDDGHVTLFVDRVAETHAWLQAHGAA